jgi:GGDEF domain-containing protein
MIDKKEYDEWELRRRKMDNAEILKYIEEWLEKEVETYKQYEDDMGDVDSFDKGIVVGRHECAEELLKQIAKRKEEMNDG